MISYPTILRFENFWIVIKLALCYYAHVYTIRFTKQADKAIRKIPRSAARLIRDKLEQIAADPIARRSDVTQLINRPGYRLRVGKWRVIYEIRNDEVLIVVLKIATRGSIYK